MAQRQALEPERCPVSSEGCCGLQGPCSSTQCMQAGKGISYPLGEVEGSNPQGPEAAQHGEKGQAQVVPGGKHQEMILTFAVTGGVALQNQMDSAHAHLPVLPCRLRLSPSPPSSCSLLAPSHILTHFQPANSRSEFQKYFSLLSPL